MAEIACKEWRCDASTLIIVRNYSYCTIVSRLVAREGEWVVNGFGKPPYPSSNIIIAFVSYITFSSEYW